MLYVPLKWKAQNVFENQHQSKSWTCHSSANHLMSSYLGPRWSFKHSLDNDPFFLEFWVITKNLHGVRAVSKEKTENKREQTGTLCLKFYAKKVKLGNQWFPPIPWLALIEDHLDLILVLVQHTGCRKLFLALKTHRRKLPPPPPSHPALPLLVCPLPRNDLALGSLISPISPNAPWRSSAWTASAFATPRRGLPELRELICGRNGGIAVGVGVVDGRIQRGWGGHWEPGQWHRGGRGSLIFPSLALPLLLLLPLQVPQGLDAARLGDKQAGTSVKDRAHRRLRPRSHRRPGQRWRWTRG